MKVTNPWRCDFCKSLKGEGNGWLIGVVIVKNRKPVIQIGTWSNAEAGRSAATHLCGVRCVLSFVQAEVGKLVPAINPFDPKLRVGEDAPKPTGQAAFVSPNQAAEDEAIEKAKFDRRGEQGVSIDVESDPQDQKWE